MITKEDLNFISSVRLEKWEDLQRIENMLPNTKDERLLEPLFDLLGNNPNFNFGLPGNVVHYLELFENNIYTVALYKALELHPTEHLIWMLNRYINSVEGAEKEEGISYLRKLLDKYKDTNLNECISAFLENYE